MFDTGLHHGDSPKLYRSSPIESNTIADLRGASHPACSNAGADGRWVVGRRSRARPIPQALRSGRRVERAAVPPTAKSVLVATHLTRSLPFPYSALGCAASPPTPPGRLQARSSCASERSFSLVYPRDTLVIESPSQSSLHLYLRHHTSLPRSLEPSRHVWTVCACRLRLC